MGENKKKEEKVQTGLRIPQERYVELSDMAARSGVSINSLALFLIDIGLAVINRGVEEEARSLPRIPQHTDE